MPLGDREALECYVARGRYLFDRQSSHDVIEIYRFHHKVSCIQKYIHLIISTQWFSSWLLRMSRKLIYNLLTSLSTISAKCRRPSLHYIITTYSPLLLISATSSQYSCKIGKWFRESLIWLTGNMKKTFLFVRFRDCYHSPSVGLPLWYENSIIDGRPVSLKVNLITIS